MSNYCHRLKHRQLILTLAFLALGPLAGATSNRCSSLITNQTYRSEVQRQWAYLDALKVHQDKSLKRKSKRLLREIQNHAYANGLILDADPNNSAALLVRVLQATDTSQAHPLNRFATSIFKKQKIRIEINPLKLKLDEAGALFDDDTRRLTIALDNVLDLKTDSFVGHELRHAYSSYLEELGIEHVFMGWIKRKEKTPILHETYPDIFSFDELPAYYYQVLTLLREAQRDPTLLITAKQFIHHGLELLKHFTNTEVSKFASNYHFSSKVEEKYQTISIETSRYTLDFNFIKKNIRNNQLLNELALKRLSDLTSRAKAMQVQLQLAQEMLEESAPLKNVIEVLGSKRNAIDPKKAYSSEFSVNNF